jgi:hypothetical protein
MQDQVDLRLGRSIERPASHLVDRPQLMGMTRPPQCRRDALVEHPPHRQMNNALAEALREAIEPVHGGQILYEPGPDELWVVTPQIVAIENRIRPHPAGQEASAQRAISKHRDFIFPAIG